MHFFNKPDILIFNVKIKVSFIYIDLLRHIYTCQFIYKKLLLPILQNIVLQKLSEYLSWSFTHHSDLFNYSMINNKIISYKVIE